MNQQEERENSSVETGNGQLPEEAVLDVESADSDDARDIEDAEESQETPEETIARLESELAETQNQAANAIDTMQRAVAEYENAGKRRERQRQERIRRDKESMMRQLFPNESRKRSEPGFTASSKFSRNSWTFSSTPRSNRWRDVANSTQTGTRPSRMSRAPMSPADISSRHYAPVTASRIESCDPRSSASHSE